MKFVAALRRGRETHALEQGPLVTLAGVGGVGKTTLALEVAERSQDRFADGVWFCELALLDDGAAVSHAIAAPLRLQKKQGLGIEGTVMITADELVRVVRPGGTIGMINWTPEGFIGRRRGPCPQVFGDRVTDRTTRRQTVRMDHCATLTEAQLRFHHRGLPVQRRGARTGASAGPRLPHLLGSGRHRQRGYHAEYLLVTATKR